MWQGLWRLAVPAVAVSAVAAGRPAPAAAQAFEMLGTRAQGAGGAFVAVADDATAVYWNPAGLATGPFFSLVVDHGQLETGASEEARIDGPMAGNGTNAGAARYVSTVVAGASLPVGVSYYRLESFESGASLGDGRRPLRALVTDHVGVTLVQSVGSVLTIAATPRYVRGSAGHGQADPGGTDPLDAAERLPRRGASAFDIDVGALAVFGKTRVGLVVRNVVAPDFETPDGTEVEVPRQVRAGGAFMPSDRLVLALDVDLTRTPSLAGDRRIVAGGAEAWWGRRRIGLRGGFRANTVGEARPAGSLGGSVGVFRGFWVDAQVTRGGDRADPGWSLAGRVGF
jgi:hypothetical protein